MKLNETMVSCLRGKWYAELRLPTRPLHEHDHLPSSVNRDPRAKILLYQRKRKVDTRADTG